MATKDGAPRAAEAARAMPTHPPTGEVRDALAYDRTHLANERTFAAWLRTGLSVAAGGIAVAHLVPEPARDSWMALLLGAAFVLLGVGVIAYGAHEFARVAGELGRDSGRRSPARPGALYALTAVVAVLLLAVLLFLWSHRGTVRADAARGSAPEQGIRTP
jgi:putative membrane protein